MCFITPISSGWRQVHTRSTAAAGGSHPAWSDGNCNCKLGCMGHSLGSLSARLMLPCLFFRPPIDTTNGVKWLRCWIKARVQAFCGNIPRWRFLYFGDSYDPLLFSPEVTAKYMQPMNMRLERTRQTKIDEAKGRCYFTTQVRSYSKDSFSITPPPTTALQL